MLEWKTKKEHKKVCFSSENYYESLVSNEEKMIVVYNVALHDQSRKLSLNSDFLSRAPLSTWKEGYVVAISTKAKDKKHPRKVVYSKHNTGKGIKWKT